MWEKSRGMGVLFIVSLLLFGCGNSIQSEDDSEQPEAIHSQSQSPPLLELKIGNDAMPTFRASYSWSYYDPKEKVMVGIEMETISPTEMVNIEKARKVDKIANIELEFGESPLTYEVFVWDEAGNRNASPGNFDLSKLIGKNIFEIYAHWQQGDSSYVFALDVE